MSFVGALSHRTQLAVSVIFSVGVTASIILGYQQLKRENRVQRLKESIPDVSEEHIAARVI